MVALESADSTVMPRHTTLPLPHTHTRVKARGTHMHRRQNTHVFSELLCLPDDTGRAILDPTPAHCPRRSHTFTHAHASTRATYGPWKKAHLLRDPPPSHLPRRVPIACLANRPSAISLFILFFRDFPTFCLCFFP